MPCPAVTLLLNGNKTPRLVKDHSTVDIGYLKVPGKEYALQPDLSKKYTVGKLPREHRLVLAGL
mgnify:CR=1 FL=1